MDVQFLLSSPLCVGEETVILVAGVGCDVPNLGCLEANNVILPTVTHKCKTIFFFPNSRP